MRKTLFSKRHDRLRELLIQHRKQGQLKQIDVAKRLGRPQSFVSKYELGDRQLNVLELIEVATVLGISPAELVEDLMRIR